MPQIVRDAVLLVARVVIGVIFIAHGWQKLVDNGLDATEQGFAGMGIPAADLAAPFAAFVELIGGGMLVLGLLTPVAGVLLAVVMFGAAWFVHLDNGLFATDGGWELVVALAMAALVFAVWPGRFSVDGMVTGRRARRAEAVSAS